jgi:hypothetical protein
VVPRICEKIGIEVAHRDRAYRDSRTVGRS